MTSAHKSASVEDDKFLNAITVCDFLIFSNKLIYFKIAKVT